MKLRTLAAVVTLCGCGPGMLDYSDRIGESHYTIVRTDSHSRWVVPQSDCGTNCPSIHRDVVKLRWNKLVIAVRRQVVRDYRCDGPMLSSQYLNLYQQYVIVLKSNELLGPLSVAEYSKLVKDRPELLAGINLLEGNEMHDGNGAPQNPLGQCANARPL